MERIADRTVVKLVVSIAVLAAAILWLVRVAAPGGSPYLHVDELVTTDMSRWAGQPRKVPGWIQGNSLVDVWEHQRTMSFVLRNGEKRIRVIATAPSTWLLRPNLELVVQGRLEPASSVTIVDARCAADHR